MREQGDGRAIAFLLVNLASVVNTQGEHSRATHLCAEGVDLYRRLRHRGALPYALSIQAGRSYLSWAIARMQPLLRRELDAVQRPDRPWRRGRLRS